MTALAAVTLVVLMRTLIPDPLPAEVEALLERRHEWGADRHDEVWEGVLHMSPPPSSRHELLVDELREALRPLAKAKGMAVLGAAGIGVTDDHRVPDLALLRPRSSRSGSRPRRSPSKSCPGASPQARSLTSTPPTRSTSF